MNLSSPDGQEASVSKVCTHCGRPLSTDAGLCLQPQDGAECICPECYQDLLIPGPGDAHGNMS
jgi:hypothetical protein